MFGFDLATLFWQFATSAFVLGILGVVVVASFAVAYFPFARWIPMLAPYAKLALFVSYLSLSVLTFLLGYNASDERQESMRLRNEVSWRQLQLDEHENAAKDAEKLKEAAEQEARDAKGKLDDYIHRLGPVDARCAWRCDSIERLLALRNRSDPAVRSALARLRAACAASPTP